MSRSREFLGWLYPPSVLNRSVIVQAPDETAKQPTDLLSTLPTREFGHHESNEANIAARSMRRVSSSQSEPCAIDSRCFDLRSSETTLSPRRYWQEWRRPHVAAGSSRPNRSSAGQSEGRAVDRRSTNCLLFCHAIRSRYVPSQAGMPLLPLRSDSSTPPLRPPRLGGGFSDDDVLEELDGAGEAFVDAHQGVFVLDGDGAVVAGEAQLADQCAPELLAMAVADRAEDPGAVDLVGVWLGVENAVDGDIRSRRARCPWRGRGRWRRRGRGRRPADPSPARRGARGRS